MKSNMMTSQKVTQSTAELDIINNIRAQHLSTGAFCEADKH